MSSQPSAAFAPERIAEMLRVSVAEVLARIEPDRLHPERCWRATRRALRVEGGGLVHVLDVEARRLGWPVPEMPTGGWSARISVDFPREQDDAEEADAPAPPKREIKVSNPRLREASRARMARRRAAREAKK